MKQPGVFRMSYMLQQLHVAKSCLASTRSLLSYMWTTIRHVEKIQNHSSYCSDVCLFPLFFPLFFYFSFVFSPLLCWDHARSGNVKKTDPGLQDFQYASSQLVVIGCFKKSFVVFYSKIVLLLFKYDEIIFLHLMYLFYGIFCCSFTMDWSYSVKAKRRLKAVSSL